MWLIRRGPHILILGRVWRRVVSFTYQTVFCSGKGHPIHLIVDCVGLRDRLGTLIKKKLLYLPEIETPILKHLVPNLVSITTQTFKLIFYICPPPIFTCTAPIAPPFSCCDIPIRLLHCVGISHYLRTKSYRHQLQI